MKNLYAICTLMLCSFSTLPAQFSLGVSPQYLHALGQLKTEGYRPGVGFNLDVMYGEFGTRLPLVFQLGLQADIGFHGSEVKPIVLLSGESADIRLRNQHVGLLGSVRVLSPYAPFRAYAEGLIGGRYFFSQDVFTVESAEEPDIEEVAGSFTWSYGGAVGFLVKLNEELSLDFRLRYLQGSWAEYVNLDTVEEVNNQVYYDFERSETQLLSVMAGLNVWLN